MITHRLGEIRQRLADLSIVAAQLVGQVDVLGRELAELERQPKPQTEQIKAKKVVPDKCEVCGTPTPTEGSMRYHRRKHHADLVKPRKSQKKGRPFSLEIIKQVLEAQKEMKASEICKKFNISSFNFYNWRKKYGKFGQEITV